MPTDNDETGEVLQILKTENNALFKDNYQLTAQKIQNVEKSFEIVTAKSMPKNLPKKRTHRFLPAALGRSDELFLLCAFAGGKALINIYAKLKTELDIEKILKWWDTARRSPKLESFRRDFFKFNNQHPIGENIITEHTV